MTIHPSLHSSKSTEWGTPQWLFDALDREFGFTLDPCSTHANAKCALHFTIDEDGLSQDWADHVVFMNPPYRTAGAWIEKAYKSAQRGATVVCLIPSRTDVAYWHRYVSKGEVRFLKGRLRFDGGKHCAPFPSAIVIFRPPTRRISMVDMRPEGGVGLD